MSSDNTVVIPLSKKKLVLLVLGAAAFVIVGAVFLLIAREESGFEALFLKILGWATVGFFGLALLIGLRKLADFRPGLVISDTGIEDNSSGISAGLIPWNEIQGIDVTSVNAQQFLTIYVVNPGKYIDRGNILRRIASRANMNFYGSPIQISANSLKTGFDELLALIEQGFERYGGR